MLDGRRREDWNHTSAQLAMAANCARDPKLRPQPYQPTEFHPMHVEQDSDEPSSSEVFAHYERMWNALGESQQ